MLKDNSTLTLHASRRQGGNIALICALALVPLMVILAAAVEYMRVADVRMQLQAAADAGALAAARDPFASQDAIEAVARNTLLSNASSNKMGEVSFGPATVASDLNSVTYSATSKVSLVFGRLLGVPYIIVPASATAKRPGGSIQVALVLDATTSMADNLIDPDTGVDSGQSKIQVLKSAARVLANTLLPATPAANPAQMAIVPFGQFVQARSPTDPGDLQMGVGYPQTDFSKWIVMPYTRPDNCILSSECYYRCTVDNSPNGSCVNMSLPGCHVVSCTPPVSVCVSYRQPAYRDTITMPGVVGAIPEEAKYQGVNAYCPPWNYGLSRFRSTVLGRINQVNVVNNETWIPSGLLWGWNMLTPDLPYAAPPVDTVEARGGRRALILISDGANTVTPNDSTLPQPQGVRGFFFKWPLSLNSPPVAVSRARDPDEETRTVCSNIRARGSDGVQIDIYAVMVGIKDPALRKLMEDCAGTPRYGETNVFTVTNAAQLGAAFSTIARQLQAVKLLN